MALSIKNPEAVAAPQDVEVKAEAAAAVEATAAVVIPEGILGSKSDKIVLVSPLGDPSREDVTPRTINGQDATTTTSTIVGYLFKALEDMDVPCVAMGDDARKNPMSYKENELGNTIHVAAGETFPLTRFETGVLLSQPQFNARVTGEGREFTVVYQKSSGTPKGADGSVARVNADRLPTVSLRGIDVSIKDLQMIDVLTFERTQTTDSKGNTRNQIINRQIVKGYEKFEPLCRAAVRKPAQGAAAPKDQYNKAAGAFLKMLSARHQG